jgi:hypothetical protein
MRAGPMRAGPMRAAAFCLALGLCAGPAMAEITSGGERPPAASGTRVGAELSGDIRASCWQEGREIVSEANFANGAIPPGLREQAINLEGSGRRAVLLPIGDTFCLLTVRP